MVEALINEKPKLCIVDTGASISVMSKDEWQLLKGGDSPLTPSDIVAEAANNSPLEFWVRQPLVLLLNLDSRLVMSSMLQMSCYQGLFLAWNRLADE